MAERRGGKKRRIQDEPERSDYKSEMAYKDALRKYETYRAAQRVWRQVTPEEKAWILETYTRFKKDEIQAALEIDAATGGDLSGFRLTRKQIRAIAKYPRSQHRREIYKLHLAASPARKDVRVRKHEKRLQQSGLRRPW